MYTPILFIILALAVGFLAGCFATALLCGSRSRSVRWYDAARHMPIDYEADGYIRCIVVTSSGDIYEDMWNANQYRFEGTEPDDAVLYFAYVEDFRDTLPTYPHTVTIAHP